MSRLELAGCNQEVLFAELAEAPLGTLERTEILLWAWVFVAQELLFLIDLFPGAGSSQGFQSPLA